MLCVVTVRRRIVVTSSHRVELFGARSVGDVALSRRSWCLRARRGCCWWWAVVAMGDRRDVAVVGGRRGWWWLRKKGVWIVVDAKSSIGVCRGSFGNV
jgi:hypothetical protein